MDPLEDRAPELSSMTATVEELRRRVTAIAEATVDTRADRVTGGPGTLSVSSELFEVERALDEAARRLGAVADALRSSR